MKDVAGEQAHACSPAFLQGAFFCARRKDTLRVV
jgi:hypothetical protein